MDKQQLEKDVDLLKKEKVRFSAEIRRLKKYLNHQEKIIEVEKTLEKIRVEIDKRVQCLDDVDDVSELNTLVRTLENVLDYRRFLEEMK